MTSPSGNSVGASTVISGGVKPRAALVLVAAVGLAIASCQSSSPPPGFVIGGIAPCSGLPPNLVPNLPRYAAGTVTVLRGQVHESAAQIVLPTTVVTQETVGTNEQYEFTLAPGQYVLRVLYAGAATPGPGWLSITVKSGQTLRADFPNACK